jgi:linoleate 10R-lipoxygenase
VQSGLQLKSDDNPKGTLLEQDVYHDFATVAEYILLNFEPTNDWSLRERSIAFYKTFESAVLDYLEHPIISCIIDWIAQRNDQEVKQFLKDMKKGDRKDEAKLLAASIFAHLVPSAAQYSQVLSLVVEYYADDEVSKSKFVKLAGKNTKQANQEIIQLIHEALGECIFLVYLDTYKLILIA